MKLCILFLTLLAFETLPAQDLNYGRLSRNDWSSIMKGNQALQTKKSDNIDMKGTPFIYDTYEKGALILSDSSKSPDDFTFKVNAEDDEIWFLTPKKEELVLTDKRIVGLDLIVGKDTHSFRKILLTDVKTNPLRFAEVLYQGNKFALVKYTNKLFEPATAVDKGLAVVGKNYDNYATLTDYYVLTSKKVYKKIALKKNDIYKADLPLAEKNRDAIIAFCKQNKISNPLEEGDAIDLLEFMDGLK
jgi:hypothetical protein